MEQPDQSVSQPSLEMEDFTDLEDFTHEPEFEEPTCKKCKSTISDCWNFFTKIDGEDGKERARCNACGKELKVEDCLDGTSLLIHHIEQCDEIEIEDARQLVKDMQGQSKYPAIYLLVLLKKAVAAVLLHDMPINVFDEEDFMKMKITVIAVKMKMKMGMMMMVLMVEELDHPFTLAIY
ncbi:hypothetical protein Ahy_B06g086069 [Arachis hypogaea]|uniref:BED-type domain-containing protein n=1 Tax=Arachis hypogaea TaxID=3818 RepID=A0A444YWN0_ARAHY|nr:hypothetical protein Ahy_B06g086069 [Arachis hypogaea]